MSLGHVLDHVLNHVLDYVLNHVLDQMIIGFLTTALQLLSSLA